MIEGEAAKYGKSVEVIYYENENLDLIYVATIDDSIYKVNRAGRDQSVFRKNTLDLNDFIEKNIPYLELADKYQTDNIAYLVFVNEIGYSYSSAYTRAYPDAALPSEARYHEKAVIFNQVGTGDTVFHEIMHLFGVPDYYRTGIDEDFGVSSEFAEYVYLTYPQEVMTNSGTEKVTRDFDEHPPNQHISPLTAYRLGWLDDIPELKQFPNFKRPGNVPGIWAPYWYEPKN